MTLLKTGKGRNIGEGNRLKEYDGIEYTHDPLGNLIYRELPNGEKQYFQYDTENQLTRAEIKKPQGNTEIWEYAYDPFGRRLSKERKDKLAWVSTAPKRTHFVWDGTRLLQEYTYKGNYTYLYTDQDSYEPLAQVFYNRKDDKQYLSYYHTDQIGIPREMTDQFGNLLWFGEYTAWGALASEKRIYQNAHQPFRLQNQYHDAETGLHYNFLRYYEPDTGRFINQDPIGLLGGDNLYQFAPNVQDWIDPWGLAAEGSLGPHGQMKGGGNQAHEFIRHKLLQLMGEAKGDTRLSSNPSIAASLERHQGKNNPNSIHKNEKRLAQKHLGLKSKNQFSTSVCTRSGSKNGKIMPSKRQMDIWQGAIRQAGYGASRARKLRKQAEKFLKGLGY